MRLRNQKASNRVLDKTAEPAPYYRGFDGNVRYIEPGDDYLMKYDMEDRTGFNIYSPKEKDALRKGVDLRTILFLRALEDREYDNHFNWKR